MTSIPRPKVTLVGKGVCYDTGGLDIKPGNSMTAMKKDMAGSAQVTAAAGASAALKLLLQGGTLTLLLSFYCYYLLGARASQHADGS